MIAGNARLSASLLAALACTGAATAQTYPARPIRFVVPTGPGGGPDLVARLLVPSLTAHTGQQIVVDNRPGANAMLAADAVAKAPPDGHTWLFGTGQNTVNPSLLKSMTHDIVKDFAPVTLVLHAPYLLVVHPSLPARSVKELIALARSRPGKLNFGSGGVGSAAHLSGELFKAMAKVDIVRVAYKGGGPALNAILSGETQVMFATGSGSAAHFKSGRLRPLAVTTLKRSALFPDLPTLAETGLPGYEAASTTCLFAPGATPAPVVARIAQDLVQYLGRPESRERFLKAGMDLVASSPAELAAAMKADIQSMEKLVREAGIRGE